MTSTDPLTIVCGLGFAPPHGWSDPPVQAAVTSAWHRIVELEKENSRLLRHLDHAQGIIAGRYGGEPLALIEELDAERLAHSETARAGLSVVREKSEYIEHQRTHIATLKAQIDALNAAALSHAEQVDIRDKRIREALAALRTAELRIRDLEETLRREREKVKINPARPIASIYVSKNGSSIDVCLDNSVQDYSEWIKGEGADIALNRSLETNKVCGAHLPLYAKSLVIGGTGIKPLCIDLESGVIGTPLPDPEAAAALEQLRAALDATETKDGSDAWLLPPLRRVVVHRP